MSRVFVVQDHHKSTPDGRLVPRYDLTPAQSFGPLIPVFGPADHPFNNKYFPNVLQQALRTLIDFSDDDYLLLVGNPVLIGIATVLASRSNGGKVRFLQWNSLRRAYIPITVRIENDRRI